MFLIKLNILSFLPLIWYSKKVKKISTRSNLKLFPGLRESYLSGKKSTNINIRLKHVLLFSSVSERLFRFKQHNLLWVIEAGNGTGYLNRSFGRPRELCVGDIGQE